MDTLTDQLIETVRRPPDSERLRQHFRDMGYVGVVDSGVFERIPLLGTIYGLGKTALNIRDRIFISKVLSFLSSVGDDTSQEERDCFCHRLRNDPSYRAKVADTLLVLLDRLDHLDKADLLAKILVGLIHDRIDEDTYWRLATSVDRAFMGDLRELLGYYSSESETSMHEPIWERLLGVGLSSMYRRRSRESRIIVGPVSPNPTPMQRCSRN